MFSAISRVFKTPDLRRKILFTLAMLAIYRLGTAIPAPFVNYSNVQQCIAGSGADGQASLFNMLNMFSGGALTQLSIFALGIMPYITASIIVQLLRVVIPHFEALHKEGQSGQATLTQYTRYLTIGLAVLQSTTLLTVARTGALYGTTGNAACQNVLNFVTETTGLDVTTNVVRMLMMVTALTAGTAVIMWFGELITERGIGNGMSLLIFTSIAAMFPTGMWSLISGAGGVFTFVVIILLAFGVLVAVVFVEQSQRRIPVQYARRMIGRRTYGGQSTYIPIKVNQAGVIPVIFSSSLLMIPSLIAQFNQPAAGESPAEWVVWIQNNLMTGDSWIYMVVYFLLTIAFAYFYVYIAFNPDEVAENMRKQGGFVPGIRAGQPTADYLSYVLNRITFPGSIYLGIIALLPLIALSTVGANQNFPFGGASILILVGVGLETVKQIDAQLQQRNYEGLLR
ncbi:preprotein translocase subunit SecY [Gulosibacter chungangensis]|uniref:Protein translocase subunit SecY n=1 Tax=Gulosibacter chungangensis TaxID=979746 RepID=A0A7J5B7M8_9MICO|nr:preprotein translocase subunit SecY [Gulosibacter chungangensis]KAB1640956.1 preprotein translocase subunit SecY [Gulosibacter chungangensis]